MFCPTRLEQLFGYYSALGGTGGSRYATAKSKHNVPCPAAAGVTACKRKFGGVTLAPRIKEKKIQSIASSKGQVHKPRVLPTSSMLGLSQSTACKRKSGGVTPVPDSKKRRVEVGSSSTKGGEHPEEDLVGSVGDSESAHRLRHPVPLSQCARCQWLAWGSSWKEKQGSFRTERHGGAERIEWVAERGLSRGGAWGLGCSVCAHAVRKLKGESGFDYRKKTRPAGFEVGSIRNSA